MADTQTKDNDRRKTINGVLCCPLCRGALYDEEGAKKCGAGHGPFPVDPECRIHFLPDAESRAYQSKHLSGINSLKSFLKRSPRLYYFVWHIFCPVFMSGPGPRSARKMAPAGAVMLNIGSGPRRIGADFVNVDIFPFPEVDVIADVHHLPFPDSSIDAVVHESLLEHVADPAKVAGEISRVLKPGGILYASVPFMTPYHASPDDFNRWTKSGLRVLFSGFTPAEEGVDAGPWSAFLVFLAYFLGVLFSFGSRRTAPFLAFVFMLVLGPLKIFDYVFARLPGADAVAAQLYFIGRKK